MAEPPLPIPAVDERRRLAFDSYARAYDAIRPSYPDALVDDVLARTGARRILEVGAGTGLATVLFARRGCEIVAYEPGENLAAILREKTRDLPRVEVRVAKFETWDGVPGEFDLVLAAQSFHWIDPATRYARAARAARHLAVLTNEIDAIDPAVRAEFDAAYDEWTGAGDANAQARIAVAEARRTWTYQIDASGLYGPVHVGAFPWTREYTTAEYLALLSTYSEQAVLPDDRRRGLHAAIAAAIDRHGGRLLLPRVSLSFLASAR
jgi:SAM-dependent methyltransferase